MKGEPTVRHGQQVRDKSTRKHLFFCPIIEIEVNDELPTG